MKESQKSKTKKSISKIPKHQTTKPLIMLYITPIFIKTIQKPFQNYTPKLYQNPTKPFLQILPIEEKRNTSHPNPVTK